MTSGARVPLLLEVQVEGSRIEQVAGTELRGGIHLPIRGRAVGPQLVLCFRWHTEGRGRTDEGVLEAPLPPGPRPPEPCIVPFVARLPSAPWTYHGRLLKILWELYAEARAPGCTAERGPSTPLTLLSPFADAQRTAYR